MTSSIDLRDTFVHLKHSGATPVETGPDFWQALEDGTRAYPGRLAMILPMQADFPHWEMHPQGEELIVMMRGVCVMVLDDGTGETRVELAAGQAMLVPTGVWHRAEIIEAGEALFVTEGEGTQHRPL